VDLSCVWQSTDDDDDDDAAAAAAVAFQEIFLFSPIKHNNIFIMYIKLHVSTLSTGHDQAIQNVKHRYEYREKQ
jgi:hypothetical protein